MITRMYVCVKRPLPFSTYLLPKASTFTFWAAAVPVEGACQTCILCSNLKFLHCTPLALCMLNRIASQAFVLVALDWKSFSHKMQFLSNIKGCLLPMFEPSLLQLLGMQLLFPHLDLFEMALQPFELSFPQALMLCTSYIASFWLPPSVIHAQLGIHALIVAFIFFLARHVT